MLKRFLFVTGILLALTNIQANGPFGLGLMVGNFNGITMKYKVGSANAIAAGAHIPLGKNRGIGVYGDYLFILPNAIHLDVPAHFLYYGLGAGLYTGGSDLALGVRIPFGLGVPIYDVMEVFLEIVPSLGVIPEVGFDFFNAGLGFRYFF